MQETKVAEVFYPGTSSTPIPLFISPVSAGTPADADSQVEQFVDLNELLITHPSASFFVRVQGNSMLPGIHPGDICIVNKALDPSSNSIVIAILDGEFLVKRYILKDGKPHLMADNPLFKNTIPLENYSNAEIWGVVTWVISKASLGSD